jgi:polysaccharide deacetylase family protein (PEP-CTERM system associated)
MTPTEFYDDALRARLLLEDTAGCAVYGYRCPGFSTTMETPWFFKTLAAAGYRYDSSVFPAKRAHGGMPHAARLPHIVEAGQHTKLLEFPISIAELCGKSMCFFGGGYLRLFPYWLIRRMTNQVLNSGRPVVFYVHPREIDPHHPRLAMNICRRFKCYVNLGTTETKIRHILDDFAVTTFRNFLLRHAPHLESFQPNDFWAQCERWRSAA